MSQVGIAVIGTGIIGRSHIKNYQDIADANLVAVCDINEDGARAAAQEYGIPDVYTDFHAVLERDDVQAVDVCLHNNLHAPVAIAAMKAGKHVYCEKPLAGSFADAKAMVDTAAETGMKLSMQVGTLFSDGTIAAKRLIDDGHLGKVYYAKSSGFRRRGRPFVDGYATPAFVQKEVAAGGALYDMGVYHISQILYLLGAPAIRTISGSTFQELDMYEHRRKESGYNVEEFAVGLVRLQDGMTMFLEEAWALNLGGMDSSKIVGSKGGVTLNPFTFHSTISDMEMNATFDVGSARSRWKRVFPESEALDGNQPHWVAALKGETELLPTARVGMDMMLIAEGIFLSQERGEEVTAEEVAKLSRSTALKL
jgi:predicted dehydrogenase